MGTVNETGCRRRPLEQGQADRTARVTIRTRHAAERDGTGPDRRLQSHCHVLHLWVVGAPAVAHARGEVAGPDEGEVQSGHRDHLADARQSVHVLDSGDGEHLAVGAVLVFARREPPAQRCI